jgi:hypothetical protein
VAHGYLTGGDIAKFNVIIIPSGSPGALSARLGKGGADRLRSWMQSGGTLITMGGSSAWAAGEDANFTSARAVGAEGDSGGAAASGDTPRAPAADSAGRANPPPRTGADKQQDALLATASPTASDASPQPVPGANFDACWTARTG